MKTAAWWLLQAVLLFFWGGVLALVVRFEHSTLESWWVDYQDHDRGIWEGAIIAMTVQGFYYVSRRVLHRKEKRADGST